MNFGNKKKGGKCMPFILMYLEEREGAIGPTTSGTWDDIDVADAS